MTGGVGKSSCGAERGFTTGGLGFGWPVQSEKGSRRGNRWHGKEDISLKGGQRHQAKTIRGKKRKRRKPQVFKRSGGWERR